MHGWILRWFLRHRCTRMPIKVWVNYDCSKCIRIAPNTSWKNLKISQFSSYLLCRCRCIRSGKGHQGRKLVPAGSNCLQKYSHTGPQAHIHLHSEGNPRHRQIPPCTELHSLILTSLSDTTWSSCCYRAHNGCLVDSGHLRVRKDQNYNSRNSQEFVSVVRAAQVGHRTWPIMT